MAPPVYRGPWLILRLQVLARDNWQCQLRLPGCKGHANQVDHIVGIAQGGSWWDAANCRAACKPCNVAKGNQDNPRGAPWKRKADPTWQW